MAIEITTADSTTITGIRNALKAANLSGSFTWDSAYTTTHDNSANWNSTTATVYANSANWNSTTATVYANSANWDSTTATVYANSANWDSTYTTTIANSAAWSSAYTTTRANSASVNSVYTTTRTNSAIWGTGGVSQDLSLLTTTSASWNSTYTTTKANSAYWADTRNNVIFAKSLSASSMITNSLTALLQSVFLSNVGIGTTNPGANLDISAGVIGGSHVGPSLRLTNGFDDQGAATWVPDVDYAGSVDYFTVDGSGGGGGAGPNVISFIRPYVQNITGSAWALSFGVSTANGPATERMRIANTGYVGIGTTSPSQQLHVAGNVLASSVYTSTAIGIGTSSPARMLTVDHATTPEIGLYTAGTERVKFSTNGSATSQLAIDTGGSTRLIITSAGNVGIGTNAPGSNLTVKPSTAGQGITVRESDNGQDALRLDGYLNGGLFQMFTGGVSTIAFNSTEAAGVNYFNTGNVGIGTTSPGATLTVSGTISGSNTITAAGGSSNQWNSVYTNVNTNSALYGFIAAVIYG